MAKEKRTRFIIEPSKLALISRGIVSAAAIRNTDRARKLVHLAEHAYSLRDMSTVEGIARHLSLADDPRVASAGQWFQAVARLRAGDKVEAEHLILPLIGSEKAAPRYRGRALQTLGLIHQIQNDHESAARAYREASRLSAVCRDPVALLLSGLSSVTLSAQVGDFPVMLAELRALVPIVEILSRTHPLYEALFCNSVAFGLANEGRIQEARAFISHALRSPFAFAYPEIQETAREIKQLAEAKLALNQNVRPAVQQARKASPRPKLRLVKKLCPVVLHTSTRRRTGSITIIKPEQPRIRPTLEQICFKIRIRAPSF